MNPPFHTSSAPPPPPHVRPVRSAHLPASVREAASGIVPAGGDGSVRRGRLPVPEPPSARAAALAYAASIPREAFGVNAIPRLRTARPAHVDLSAEAKLAAEKLRFDSGLAAPVRVRAPTLTLQASRAVQESMEAGSAAAGGSSYAPAATSAYASAFGSRDAVPTATGALSFPMPSALRARGEGASVAAKAARGVATADHLTFGGAGGIVANAATYEADRRVFEREHSAALPGRARCVQDQASDAARDALSGGGGAGVAPPPVPVSSLGAPDLRAGSIPILRRHHQQLYGGVEVASVLPHAEAARPVLAAAVAPRAPGATASSAAHDGRQSGPPAAHEPKRRAFGGEHGGYVKTSLW
jgi:hypothetical protein